MIFVDVLGIGHPDRSILFIDLSPQAILDLWWKLETDVVTLKDL
jgi:hypothetical protein